ncbi:hypothetical protein [Herminiimonas aquatilis]|uniref:Carboxypeptidase regulatory-like domain-containing protein n=1 Tax=Herminiimonas aquatilis TaxID=345342 RepID=A0ABW2J9P2_9BURK
MTYVTASPVEFKTEHASYISGGIGSDEAAEMRAMAPRYTLEIVSIVKSKSAGREQYTADFRVQVKDLKDMVLIDAASEGPIFLVNLPKGNYQIAATQNGITKSQKISVQKGTHRRIVFIWQE